MIRPNYRNTKEGELWGPDDSLMFLAETCGLILTQYNAVLNDRNNHFHLFTVVTSVP